MIDRQHGKVVFECDSCGEALQTDERDFAEALSMAKHEGWKMRKVGADWVHACPNCEVPR